MAASRTTFEKLQRERAKKLRKELKQAKRQGQSSDQSGSGDEPEVVDVADAAPDQGEIPPDQLLALVEKLTTQHHQGLISDEEFEQQKTELFARLTSE